MNELIYISVSFAVAFVIGRFLIPFITLVSKKYRLFDKPNNRTVHAIKTPRLGGISFFPAAVLAFFAGVITINILEPEIIATFVPSDYIRLLSFLAGWIIIFVVGFFDDLSEISYRRKFIFQIMAATMIVASKLYPENMSGVLSIESINPVLSIPLTIISAVLIINAYNLIDGVDGLCAGLSIVSLSALAFMFHETNQILPVVYLAGIVGVVSSFFVYNVFGGRFKTFMGDSGSLALGYAIAYAIFMFVSEKTVGGSAVLEGNRFALAAGVVFVPVFDAVRLFFMRIIKGNSPFLADNNHIHHKFLALGFSHINTTLSIVSLQIGIILLNTYLARSVNINAIIALDILLGLAVNAGLNLAVSLSNKPASPAYEVVVDNKPEPENVVIMNDTGHENQDI